MQGELHETDEQWRPVVGYEGYYEVSDHGRVRGVNRTVKARNGFTYRLRGRVLRAAPHGPYGHLSVHLRMNRCGRTCAVHRLVLCAFVGLPPDGMECCHNNGVASDNRLTNLRWDTSSANSYDIVRCGTHWGANKIACPRSHRLISPNLVKVALEDGRRDCLACNRARSAGYRAKRRGIEFDFPAAADVYYVAIMSGGQEEHAA